MAQRDGDIRAASLRAAMVLIQEVLATLDRTHTVCPGCERDYYNNWSEAQLATELEGVVRKIEKHIHRLNANRKGTSHV